MADFSDPTKGARAAAELEAAAANLKRLVERDAEKLDRLRASNAEMLALLKAVIGSPQAAVCLTRIPFGKFEGVGWFGKELHETNVHDAICAVVARPAA